MLNHGGLTPLKEARSRQSHRRLKPGGFMVAPRRSQLAARRRLAARLKANRRAIFWIGAALAAAGAATMAFPGISVVLVGAVVGWLLWFAGAVMVVVSLLIRAPGSLFGALLAGLTAIGGGAFLLFNPLAGALAMTVLIAAVLIVDGAFELALALDLRPLRAWRWVLSSALASGVAGLFVAAGAGARSPATLALLLGAAFASSGLALMALSRPAARRAGPRSLGANSFEPRQIGRATSPAPALREDPPRRAF
jgi:uncharacterized membrane protein HdeD (DUF308 family)